MSRESCACQSGRWMSQTARSSLLWKKPKLFSHASMQGRLCEYSGTFFSGSFFLHSSMSQVLPPVAIAWHLWHTILINPICCICLLLPHASPAFPPSHCNPQKFHEFQFLSAILQGLSGTFPSLMYWTKALLKDTKHSFICSHAQRWCINMANSRTFFHTSFEWCKIALTL